MHKSEHNKSYKYDKYPYPYIIVNKGIYLITRKLRDHL